MLVMKRLLILVGLTIGFCMLVSAQQSRITLKKPPIEPIDATTYRDVLGIEEVIAPRYSLTMISGGYYFCDPRACDPLWDVAAGLSARFESYDLLMGHPVGYDITVIINRYDENERELMLALNRIRHNRRLK